jgi:hypothetical protein
MHAATYLVHSFVSLRTTAWTLVASLYAFDPPLRYGKTRRVRSLTVLIGAHVAASQPASGGYADRDH